MLFKFSKILQIQTNVVENCSDFVIVAGGRGRSGARTRRKGSGARRRRGPRWRVWLLSGPTQRAALVRRACNIKPHCSCRWGPCPSPTPRFGASLLFVYILATNTGTPREPPNIHTSKQLLGGENEFHAACTTCFALLAARSLLPMRRVLCDDCREFELIST